MLTTDLAVWPGIEIVSRPMLGEILREQWLQHRGTSDPSSTVKIGRLVGTRYLLKGNYYVVDSQLFLEAHLLDVERGTVVRTVRTSGALTKIPALEHTLAQQIGETFGLKPSSVTITPTVATVPQSDSRTESQEKEVPIHVVPPPPQRPRSLTTPTQLLVTDALLSQEKSKAMKEDAWLAADEIWRQGLSIELGAVRYSSINNDESDDRSLAMLWVPVSAFLKPDQLNNVNRALTFTKDMEKGSSTNQGTLMWNGTDPTSQRLFKENIQTPRRLFVRAISETGEVVAVSSAGSWRIDESLESQDEGAFHISVLPTAMMTGETGFPTITVASYGKSLTFDAVVVTVPSEERRVSVEIVESTDKTEPESEQEKKASATIVTNLQEWLLEHWTPPVMESLPIAGYLPGNRRTAQMMVTGKNGLVHEVHLSQAPSETPLRLSLQELVDQLKGRCFLECPQASPTGDTQSFSFRLRVQFDLVKDIQAVGLGTQLKPG